MSPRKYKCLTIAEKKKLIEKVEKGEKKSDVAKEFKIPPSTLSTIIKYKVKINAAQNAGVRKRITKGEFPRLEESLVIWLRQCRGQKVSISGNLLKEKAREFASTLSIKNFAASEGWLTNFKKRNGVVFKKVNPVPRINRKRKSTIKVEHKPGTLKVEVDPTLNYESHHSESFNDSDHESLNDSNQEPFNNSDPFEEPLIVYNKDPLVGSRKSELFRNLSEYDAVGINVGKKLAKMDPNQAIYAEYIINNVLRKGLQKRLMDDTDLCDNGCARIN